MTFTKGFLVVCISIFSVSLFGTIAFAEQNAGITLIPATVERALDPGAVISETLKITNESNEDKEYYLYKKNISGVENGGVPVFAESSSEKTGYEITDWIEIQTEPLKVSAHQSVEIPLIVNVPSTATPGSHFGAIFISVEPPKLREIGAGVGYEVASIVSIRISGDIIDTASIRSLSTDKLLYGSKNVHFTAKIQNSGNILIRPRGPMSITNMFGAKPEVMTINEDLAGVFPGTMRDIEFDWNSEGLGFGRYEAVLALIYDGKEGQKTIDATQVFWVFPFKIMMIVLATFVTIIVGGYLFTRYYINQAIVRAAGGRRITTQRYRKQVGISRFTFIFVVLMSVFLVFLLVMLIFSA